jgi:hypothetical protein
MPISFQPIARLLARTLQPAAAVDTSAVEAFFTQVGAKPYGKSALITVNHYSAPHFGAWWFVILISAAVPVNIHWVVTSGWTNSGWLTGVTHWLFPRGANLLGFTPMPAMPPDPRDVRQRAAAMRSVLRYASHIPGAVIGMAPEGGDRPGGVLGELYPGVGRFLHLISQSCPDIIPVGVSVEQGCIQVRFGSPYQLDITPGSSPQAIDEQVGGTVMRQIALLLPESLRGEYRAWPSNLATSTIKT